MMTDVLFYLISALTLAGAGLVLVSRNPVNSAMFLVLTLGGVAGLFVLLQAFFLGAIQVLIYAGAVMVLFLFVIMLLDLKAEQRRRIKKSGLIAGILAAGLIAWIFFGNLTHSALPVMPGPVVEGDTLALGRLLFNQYVLPFEIVSVLLLVALVGVVLLSKKGLK